MSHIAKPNKNKIELIYCVAIGISMEMVYYCWECAHRFNSWDLKTFMEVAPSSTTIWKARKVLKANKVKNI